MKTKIEFAEQSKCVTAKVWIETEKEDNLTHEEQLKMVQNLFNEAQEYSKIKTMEKMR